MIRSGAANVARAATKRSAQNVARVVSVRAYSSLSRGVFCAKALRANLSSSQLSSVSKLAEMTLKRGMATFPEHEVLSMPALSPTMEQGTLASWEKKVGDKVNAGDVLANVETDKAVVSFDSTEDGYIAKILVPAGTQNVPVGTPVAIMVEDESMVAAFKDYTGDAPAAAAAAPAAPAAAAPAAAAPACEVKEGPKCSTYIAPAPMAPIASATPAAPASGSRVLASPAARIAAAERGVNLAQVKGTASNGTVCKADVLEFTPVAAAPAAASVAAPAAPSVAEVKAAVAGVPAGAAGDYVDEPTSMMRKVIAKRLTESKQSIPHYYITVEVQMDAINKLRSELNQTLAERAKKTDSEVTKLSVNDFIIKAAAAALKKVPQVNCSWQESYIRNYNYVDISVAVSTDAGLITPIIPDADLKGLASISSEMKSLAKKARQNKLQPHEYQGGTFTISNLGMFGVKHFSAIINPPQAGILAIGASDTKVVPNPAYTPENGQSQFKTVSVMSVTASYDHRVVDGAVGAQWLAAFKEFCENPVKLLL